MRAVIQRVTQAQVTINGKPKDAIEQGLVVLLGIADTDTPPDADWLATKITQMRIFSDQEGKMNLSVKDVGGNILLVSQFTLHAATKKGNRPSFIKAAKPNVALPIYNQIIKTLSLQMGQPIATGEFGANMQVSLTNNGPVTIIIDTDNKE